MGGKSAQENPPKQLSKTMPHQNNGKLSKCRHYLLRSFSADFVAFFVWLSSFGLFQINGNRAVGSFLTTKQNHATPKQTANTGIYLLRSFSADFVSLFGCCVFCFAFFLLLFLKFQIKCQQGGGFFFVGQICLLKTGGVE